MDYIHNFQFIIIFMDIYIYIEKKKQYILTKVKIGERSIKVIKCVFYVYAWDTERKGTHVRFWNFYERCGNCVEIL